MNGKSRVAGLLMLAGGACLFGGCATGPLGASRDVGGTQDPSLSNSIAARPNEGPESASALEADRLAAIEDFLARTSDYQRTEPATNHDTPADQADSRNLVQQRMASHLDALRESPDSALSAERATHAAHERPASPPDRAAANAQMSVAPPEPPARRLAIPTLLSVSVRPTGAETPGTTHALHTHPAPTSNVALDVHEPRRSFEFDDWMAELKTEAEHGRNVAAEWKLRLVELATGRDVIVDELGSALSSETRSLLGSLLETAQAVREVIANPISSGDLALERVETLRQALAERADPVVATVALCQRVVTFGVYDEMEPDDLLAGRDIQTIVYSEIQNLQGAAKSDGRFETRLATRLELFDASGTSVWLKEEPEIVDVCRRRRDDFFIAQRVTLPPTLPAGTYTLKVAIEDRHAGRAAERAVSLTIRSPISVARGR